MRKIHLQALLVLVTYSLGTKWLFTKAIFERGLGPESLFAITLNTVYAALFLFFFSHEGFFKFAKDIEKQEKKSEKKWLKKFRHWGKISATLGIGIIGGPLLSAFTARILLKRNKVNYLIVSAATLLGTIFWLFLFKSSWELVIH
ncbi:MAG: hypothetical protein Q7S31_02990 [bacterium]|nr:hypothetical protein [bacterium]